MSYIAKGIRRTSDEIIYFKPFDSRKPFFFYNQRTYWTLRIVAQGVIRFCEPAVFTTNTIFERTSRTDSGVRGACYMSRSVLFILLFCLSTLSEIFFLHTRRTSFPRYLSRRGGILRRRRRPKTFLLKNASAARNSCGGAMEVYPRRRPHPPRTHPGDQTSDARRPGVTPPLRNRPPSFRCRRQGKRAAAPRGTAHARTFPPADPRRRRRRRPQSRRTASAVTACARHSLVGRGRAPVGFPPGVRPVFDCRPPPKSRSIADGANHADPGTIASQRVGHRIRNAGEYTVTYIVKP